MKGLRFAMENDGFLDAFSKLLKTYSEDELEQILTGPYGFWCQGGCKTWLTEYYANENGVIVCPTCGVWQI
jgi:hypothetical protein